MTKELLKEIALSHLNTPYRWAGDDPLKGFDCSGLVLELLKSCGMVSEIADLNAQNIYDTFFPLAFHGALEFGSLSFYGKSTKEITHIGFLLDDKSMLEAGGGGSKTLTLEDAEKQNAYIKIRPYDRRKDLVGVLKPKYPWEGL